MNLNADLDKFLKRTLWIWLPFYAFALLLKEARERLGR
ncbi:MAG: hypothetical protein QG664_907 [Patescibacteria group bacterium]|nr:hypothetical protein [Patescibacteria group bacterium]